MVKERNRWEFYKIYSKHHLRLKKRRCCGQYINIEYIPRYGVRLSCMCGESCLTLKRAMHPEIKTEEEFVKWAVERWNSGQNDIWWENGHSIIDSTTNTNVNIVGNGYFCRDGTKCHNLRGLLDKTRGGKT